MSDKEERVGLLKIGDMAEQAGLLASTIRYYTDMGLLKVAIVTEGGHRFYEPKETMERLQKIKRLMSKGLTLTDIQAQLEDHLAKKKILVVDDEPAVVDFIQDLLKGRFPQEVQVARDGFAAGKLVSTFEPDLVVLDLMLPGVDGFEVCKQIRSDPALASTKVIVVTGYDTPEIRNKVQAVGVDDYLAKPLEVERTLEKICGLLHVDYRKKVQSPSA